jgi:hypothetical protein
MVEIFLFEKSRISYFLSMDIQDPGCRSVAFSWNIWLQEEALKV